MGINDPARMWVYVRGRGNTIIVISWCHLTDGREPHCYVKPDFVHIHSFLLSASLIHFHLRGNPQFRLSIGGMVVF